MVLLGSWAELIAGKHLLSSVAPLEAVETIPEQQRGILWLLVGSPGWTVSILGLQYPDVDLSYLNCQLSASSLNRKG